MLVVGQLISFDDIQYMYTAMDSEGVGARMFDLRRVDRCDRKKRGQWTPTRGDVDDEDERRTVAAAADARAFSSSSYR